MPRQHITIKYIKEALNQIGLPYEFIKIHGSSYQEKGLPDVQFYIRNGDKTYFFWLEIKNGWLDKPNTLQLRNVEKRFRKIGWITGFVVGKEFKYNWTDTIKTNILYLINYELYERR